MIHLGDITKLKGKDLPIVDIVDCIKSRRDIPLDAELTALS